MGNYRIHHIPTDSYLTNKGDSADFQPFKENDITQIWNVERLYAAKYNLMSLSDSLYMTKNGNMNKVKARPHRIVFAQGADYCTFSNSDDQYWEVDEDLNLILGQQTLLYEFPFELLAVNDEELTPVNDIPFTNQQQAYYTLSGIRVNEPQKGVNVFYWSQDL